MKTNRITILDTIVGSQAHGLATPESDTDRRGVFVVPTEELFKIGGKIPQTNWVENGTADDCTWEIGKFLQMGTQCNPTVLEVFKAPIIRLPNNYQEIGDEMRSLFPYIWNSIDVKNAFIGYAKNQEKKFLDKKDNRAHKYAAAYLRTLYNAYELLNTGDFTIRIADTEVGDMVRKFKNKEYTIGEVMQICADWRDKVELAYENNPKKESDINPINDFLIRVRKVFL